MFVTLGLPRGLINLKAVCEQTNNHVSFSFFYLGKKYNKKHRRKTIKKENGTSRHSCFVQASFLLLSVYASLKMVRSSNIKPHDTFKLRLRANEPNLVEFSSCLGSKMPEKKLQMHKPNQASPNTCKKQLLFTKP